MAIQTKPSKILLHWVIPLGLLALFAPFSTQIDLTLSSYFFNAETQKFSNDALYLFFYDWGMFPAQLMGIVMLLVFISSYFLRSLKKWRKSALFFMLPLVIGAGALTTLFKEEWKRPRPRQVVEFGGTVAFKPFYKPNFEAEGRFQSFPSGHCAMGFYFFSLAIFGWRMKNRTMMILGLTFALGLGVSLAVTRIALGGHFFTDTLAAACLMWIVTATSDWLLYTESNKEIRAA